MASKTNDFGLKTLACLAHFLVAVPACNICVTHVCGLRPEPH
jgi:hypothetical protein